MVVLGKKFHLIVVLSLCVCANRDLSATCLPKSNKTIRDLINLCTNSRKIFTGQQLHTPFRQPFLSVGRQMCTCNTQNQTTQEWVSLFKGDSSFYYISKTNFPQSQRIRLLVVFLSTRSFCFYKKNSLIVTLAKFFPK